tara:strand:+ start:433 stop:1464 length:1032 start_codon:yes stop_codon:yes gene_type:complete
MGGRKGERKDIARIAAQDRGASNRDVRDSQNAYDADLANLRGREIADNYSGLEFSGVGLGDLERRSGETFEGQAAQMKIADYAENERAKAEGYTAQGTNVGNLQRGAATGLSNVFNNLQVSTAGAEMAAQEADQSLAASQDLAAQAGTGAGGATALAAAAAKSKQGISADIDKQVKANEQLRAQGEQSLQRDMLAQGNLASQFDLGQSQFNVGAQNTAAQFGAQARNQASQFNAGQTNQRNAAMFTAQNQANQFNASQSNAERMAEFGALQNANAANASATNNALAQNAQNKTNFDLSKAAGMTAVDQAEYGQAMDLMNLSAEQLNNANASNDALQQLQAAGK